LLVLVVSALGLRADETGDRAARLIEKLGGKVVHDDKAPGKSVIPIIGSRRLAP